MRGHVAFTPRLVLFLLFPTLGGRTVGWAIMFHCAVLSLSVLDSVSINAFHEPKLAIRTASLPLENLPCRSAAMHALKP